MASPRSISQNGPGASGSRLGCDGAGLLCPATADAPSPPEGRLSFRAGPPDRPSPPGIRPDGRQASGDRIVRRSVAYLTITLNVEVEIPPSSSVRETVTV